MTCMVCLIMIITEVARHYEAARQVARSPYRGILDCAARILQEEGAGAFFKSFRTTVSQDQGLSSQHYHDV